MRTWEKLKYAATLPPRNRNAIDATNNHGSPTMKNCTDQIAEITKVIPTSGCKSSNPAINTYKPPARI